MPTARGRRHLPWMLLGLVIGAAACRPSAAPPRVAAASDLQFALPEVARTYTQETGRTVDLVFGSSGTLARQIQDGAPFVVFLSADERLVDQLDKAGLTRGRGEIYAIGRLALFAPTGSALVPAEGLAGLARLLDRGMPGRLAIANPTHAPYGRAAEQALRRHGLWDALQPSLVLGEHVSQAAQFASAGDAIGGIVAYSLVLAPAMRERGTHALLPAEDHEPLRQRMVLLTSADTAAEQFFRYLQTPAARATLARHGFAVPD